MVGHHRGDACPIREAVFFPPINSMTESMTILGWLPTQTWNPFLWWLNRWSYRWYDNWSRIIVESVLLFSFSVVVLISTDVFKLVSHDIPRLDSRDLRWNGFAGKREVFVVIDIQNLVVSIYWKHIRGPSWDSTLKQVKQHEIIR